MNTKSSFLCLVLCATLASVHSVDYFVQSVRSNIFESARPKGEPKTISACGKVTEPYGSLQKTYKDGEVDVGASCTWTLQAPPNHVVNVISVAFDLQDEAPGEKHTQDYSQGSQIYLYDSDVPEKNVLTSFNVDPHQNVGAFVQSISSKETMVVQVKYRKHIDYATQKIKINYEFLNKDEMEALLRIVV